jgi:hypothetical protein
LFCAFIFNYFSKGFIMTTLPRDRDNTPIPALRLNPNGAHKIDVTSIATRNSIAFDADTRIISLYATADVFIKCGDENVIATSSDHFFPANMYYDMAIGGDKVMHANYMSAMAVSDDCELYISEKE